MRPGWKLLAVCAGLFGASPAMAGQIVFSAGGDREVGRGEPLTSVRLNLNVSYGLSQWVARPAIGEHLALLTLGDAPQRGVASISTLGAELPLGSRATIWPGLGFAFDRDGRVAPAGELSLNVALTGGPLPAGIQANLGTTVDGQAWFGAALSFRFGPVG